MNTNEMQMTLAAESNDLVELTGDELESVNGGLIPVGIYIGLAVFDAAIWVHNVYSLAK